MPETEPRRCRKRPREIGLANLCAGGAVACPSSFRGACDQTALGHDVLDPGEAAHSMDVVEQHHTQNLADAGDGWQPIPGVRVVRRGRLHDGQLHVAEPLGIAAHQGEIDFHPLLHGGIREALHHPLAVGLIGQLLATLWQVILAVSLLEVREELGAFARQMPAASAPVTGGPHRGGIDLGLGAHPATESHRNLLRVDRLVCGFPAVDRLHSEGVAEDQGHRFLGAEVGEPGPRSRCLRPRRPDPPARGPGPGETSPDWVASGDGA
jgi:hypothetical protein